MHHLGPLDAASAEALCRRLLLPAENVPIAALHRLVERAHRPGADNVVRSTAFYSMLAAEWPAARLALLQKLERR